MEGLSIKRFSVILLLTAILCVAYLVRFRRPFVFDTRHRDDNAFAFTSPQEFIETINESTIRCRAKYVGCFVPVKRSIAKYHDSTSVNVTRNSLKKVCLLRCFTSNTLYAAVNEESYQACLCSKGIDGFISHAKTKLFAEDSWRLANNCTAPKSYSVYKKIRECESNMTKYSMEELMGWWNNPFESKAVGGMTVLKAVGSVNINQCILNCERRGFTIAMPSVRDSSCFCSDYATVFGKAEAVSQVFNRAPSDAFSIPIYRTIHEDPSCSIRFDNLTSKGPIALTSFPGSGNTWTRHLIEVATGIYTGSIYGDQHLYTGGFLGEMLNRRSTSSIVVKDHELNMKVRPIYHSAILLIRNPYNAVLADWSRQRTRSHVGVPKASAFKNPELLKFAETSSTKWLTHIQFVLKQAALKVLVVYYENLREDPLQEIRRALEFLQLTSTEHNYNFERRLICMQLDLNGDFKRPPRKLDFDPFADSSIRQKLDESIREANATLIRFHQPPLPSSYLS